MDTDELTIAMQYGSKNPLDEREDRDLGRFGLGLKTASLSQCRKLTVVSKKDGVIVARRWDIDYVRESGKWSLLDIDSEDDLSKISVTIYLMQSKTSESFDKGEILKFGQGAVDLVTDHPELPQSDFIKAQKEILNLIIDNVPKLLNGRPDVCLRYITNSNNPIAVEIEATRKTIIRDIENTGFFNSVEFS